MSRKRVLSRDVPGVPLNFLLSCSELTLSDYELKRLADVANTRSELHEVLDRLIDQTAEAGIVRWFRAIDRQALRAAIDNPDDVLAQARERIRDGRRSEEELVEIPRSLLPLKSAHIAASLRYQERNVAEGKCAVCPKPLDDRSVRYCTSHLAAARGRYKPKGGKDEAPGSVNYLYQDHSPEKRHGRQPGTLASLEMNREKKTRAVLAELGIPPESAAVSLKAAMEALSCACPTRKFAAMTQDELFTACAIPSRTTGQKALGALLSAGRIQRIGKGTKGDLFRYFTKRAGVVFGVPMEKLIG